MAHDLSRQIESPEIPTHTFRVCSGDTERVVGLGDVVADLAAHAEGLDGVEVERLGLSVFRGLVDGMDAEAYRMLCVHGASALTFQEIGYSRLAARLLHEHIEIETASQGVQSFADSISVGHEVGLVASRVLELVRAEAEAFEALIQHERADLFEFFGLRTLYDRYLLRHPYTRKVIETPQHFFLRVTAGLATSAADAAPLYNLMSTLSYLPSSPTLFNSATNHTQLSSCFLLDSPADDLGSIYDRYKDIAMLSKFSGGIGLPYHRVRSRGALIRSTNGASQGIVPWLKTLDSSVASVNQGGRRKGACCVYLETWHPDIEEFLELRDNTGEESRRTYNLNLANWIPDLFMKRVEEDGVWSLFDPGQHPELCDLWGEAFEQAYVAAEEAGTYARQLQARDLFGRMVKTLAETGNGWMTFKDSCNAKCNQTANPENVVHSSNLCTEIIEITNQGETAVCNLGSLNLSKYITDEGMIDEARLEHAVRTAVTFLDRVIDINLYPTAEAKASNTRWRPIGLGVMGLQDVFFKLRLPFDDPRALEISTKLQELVYFHALSTSCALAKEKGAHTSFDETRAARGELQFDLWADAAPTLPGWDALRAEIQQHGLRNSLLLAIAPTATIASIAGCYECIEPLVSNLFKRETLSGEFIQVNRYLIADLKRLGLWNDEVRELIKVHNGSVQHIEGLPDDLRHLYRTAWELSQRPIIDLAAARSPFIDQSQSLNLFMASPTIGKLSSMYFYAWKKGLKTTYYLRSRPATEIRKATLTNPNGNPALKLNFASGVALNRDPAAIACSLENPEACEACQ